MYLLIQPGTINAQMEVIMRLKHFDMEFSALNGNFYHGEIFSGKFYRG